MLEGRSTTSGWAIVGFAVVALVAFAGLLYVRGSSGPPIALSGGTQTDGAPPARSAQPGATASALTVAASAGPSASRGAAAGAAAGASASAAASGAVAGATSKPGSSRTRTPRPTRSQTPNPTDTPAASAPAGYRLPKSPQAASVALENGQGDCPNFPAGGVLVETSFAMSGTDRLTAKSPSDQRLSGRVKPDGSFSLSGTSPVERWVGTLTETGGTGSYFIVSNGCTEGYETTIAFH